MFVYLFAAWLAFVPAPHGACPRIPHAATVCTPGMSRIHGQPVVTGPVVASWR